MYDTTETTTGDLSSSIILDHAGEYAGEYQSDAYVMLNVQHELVGEMWCDIMIDKKGNCYAVYAEGALTCHDAKVLYAKLCPEDYPDRPQDY